MASNLKNSEPPSVDKQLLFQCANCKRKANSEADNGTFKVCAGCHKVKYCNRECQLADRKYHKVACKPEENNLNLTATIPRVKVNLSNLFYCCHKGDLEGLRREISRGADINAALNEQIFDTFAALMMYGFYECAELLLQHNANPNVQDMDGHTPLLIACQEGNDRFVSLLLRYNANKTARDINGLTPLHTACHYGHDKCVSLLLQHNANPNIVNNKDGYLPLHQACREGHDKCVLLLLQHKANPNAANLIADGVTPLFLACQEGHDKCVLLLLQHNANKAENYDGGSPLHIACQHGYDKCVSLLLQYNVNPNTTNTSDGNSPLQLACQSGHDKCVSLLLNAGANTESICEFGYTPLLMACTNESLKCVAMLVEHGADIHTRSIPRLRSALYLSCMSQNTNLVKYILSKGVDVNLHDMQGFNALQYCYAHGFDKFVKLLLEHGADESTMKTPIPANLLGDRTKRENLVAEYKEGRRKARHCDYPDCCNEGNDSQPLQACSSCKAVYYCSREHQNAHWKEHKKLCKAIKK